MAADRIPEKGTAARGWRTVVVWLAVILPALALALSHAAAADRAPTMLDMTGVWARNAIGVNNHFDPNTASAAEQKPPLNDAYMAIWQANLARAAGGDLSYDLSVARCLPKGFPRVMMAPLGMEIMATPKQVNFYNEASEETVRVYLDGKTEIPDHDPTYIGFTTGVWANGVLATQTRNLRGDTIFDVSGVPHSDALTVTQKFRFLDRDTLENVLTASDPKAFTRDWVVRMVYRRQPPSRYTDEFVCEQNNHDVHVGGLKK